MNDPARLMSDADIAAVWNDVDRIGAVMVEMMEEIRNIEQQLGQRDKQDPAGRRLDGVEYWEWRSRAVTARNHKLKLYRRLKERRTQLHRAAQVEHGRGDFSSRLTAIEDKLDELLALARSRT